MQTIIVAVYGGVADVVRRTVPAGIRVEVVDVDSLQETPPQDVILSEAQLAYLKEEWPELHASFTRSAGGTR